MGGFNGSGIYNRFFSWVTDSANNINITDTRMDTEDSGFATGLSNTICRDGQSTITADIPFSTHKITGLGNGSNIQDAATLANLQAQTGLWTVAGGTADALTGTYSPAHAALTDGLLCFVRATAANATTTPTFAPDLLAAHTITKEGGIAVVAGDIAGNLAEIVLRYNLANTRWELLNPAASGAPWVVAGGTADAITATYASAVPALYDGLELSFRATAANATTAPTFAPSGLTAHTITKSGGAALVAGDIVGSLAEYRVRYNLANTRWELLNPTIVPKVSTGGDVALFNGTTGSLKDSGFTLGALFRNYIQGFETGAPGGASVLTIGAGTCADDANLIIIQQTTSYTKTIASTFAVGSGNGALDTGAVASSTVYWVWAIQRPDTGVVDYLFSLSSSAPTMPTNYSNKRLIGWFKTDSSSHIPQFQQRGDDFIFGTTVTDQSSVTVGVAASLLALTVPSGFQVNALCHVRMSNAAVAGLLVTSPDETDQACSIVNGVVTLVNPAAATSGAMEVNKRTNTSAQLRFRADTASSTVSVATYGFTWTRGRNS